MDTTFTNVCLPWAAHNYTIFPYSDNLYLVNSGFGIFTSVSGTAPNRIFNIKWRARYFPGSGNANFELRLYEGQSRFDVIYRYCGQRQHISHSGRAEEHRSELYAVLTAMAVVLRLLEPKATRCNLAGVRHQHQQHRQALQPRRRPALRAHPGGGGQITTIFASNNNGDPGGALYFDITVGPKSNLRNCIGYQSCGYGTVY